MNWLALIWSGSPAFEEFVSQLSFHHALFECLDGTLILRFEYRLAVRFFTGFKSFAVSA